MKLRYNRLTIEVSYSGATHMHHQDPLRIRACSLAKKFEHNALYETLAERSKATMIKDAIIVEQDHSYAFVFDYGAVVFWGMRYDDEQRLIDVILSAATAPLESMIEDELTLRIDAQAQQIQIRNDEIELPSIDDLERLALSHALAQSVKLEEFESSVQRIIETTQYIPEALAKNGTVPLRKKELSKERGKLFLAKANVHLQHGLLDTPEFFWEYPELENHYLALARYLEVRQRIEALNQKLEVIQELLDMLADEQKHLHSSMLEWIIIILIAVEIGLFFVH